MPLTPGSRLGNYEILAPLGKGGMGEVFRARDTKLGREVAVKVLPSAFADNPERLARFEREAKVLASLNHPNIARAFDLESSGAIHFIVLEYIDGIDLYAKVKREGPLDVREAAEYVRQAAVGL